MEQHHHTTITASYAIGDVDGGAGDEDSVGGLVGGNVGAITASYATGNADGGVGDEDYVGGLVGVNVTTLIGDDTYTGTITASYATGNADGGDGANDNVGGLVGLNDGGTITASYSFGRATGFGGTAGTVRPVSDARNLTAGNAGASWNNAGNNTAGAWTSQPGTPLWSTTITMEQVQPTLHAAATMAGIRIPFRVPPPPSPAEPRWWVVTVTKGGNTMYTCTTVYNWNTQSQ